MTIPGRIVDAATALLVIAAVSVVGMAVAGRTRAPAAPSPSRLTEVTNWQQLAAVGHRIGPLNAKVQIVEFTDYQCPFCAKLYPVVEELQRAHPNEIAIIYRHLPISALHPRAFAAALAAECAAEQGRFEDYQAKLFTFRDSLRVVGWRWFAEHAAVPRLSEFEACVAAERYQNRVDRDIEAAAKIGVAGTPSLVINGRMRTGAPGKAELEQLVGLALQGKEPR